MLNKADINALFGTSGISLKKMYKKSSECLDKKFSAWAPDYFEDVVYIRSDIIIELDGSRGNSTYWVSGIQMKYIDSDKLNIMPYAFFRFHDKHGDMKTFYSTPETKLRILKMGDETQYHLEHVRKMKLD